MLFDALDVGGLRLKNRVAVPPIATFSWGAADSTVTNLQLEHYERLASGGAGLVIVEASGVTFGLECGRDVIGVWDDRFLNGLSELRSAIRRGGAAAGIQLYRPEKDASSFTNAMLCELRRDFVSAATRAARAGFDIVELHAAHGYLLDRLCYDGRRDTVAGMIADIKAKAPGLRIGVRLGISSPAPEAAVENAGAFIASGADYISISRGINEFERPFGFEYSTLVYGASLVKAYIDAPLFAVWGIRERKQAEAILENGWADAVLVGRASLSDPNWCKKVKDGVSPNPCRECARCMWYKDGRRCPAQKFL